VGNGSTDPFQVHDVSFLNCGATVFWSEYSRQHCISLMCITSSSIRYQLKVEEGMHSWDKCFNGIILDSNLLQVAMYFQFS